MNKVRNKLRVSMQGKRMSRLAVVRPRRNAVLATLRGAESESPTTNGSFSDIQRGRASRGFKALGFVTQFLVLLSALPFLGVQGAWAASPSPTPSGSPTASASPHVEYDTEKCEAACSEFTSVVTEDSATESQIKQFIQKHCGTEPTQAQKDADLKIKTADQKTKSELYTECADATTHRFKTLGPYCIAKKANTTAKGIYKTQVTTYGMAAATCGAACAWPAASGLCTAAGLTTALGEVMGLVDMAMSGGMTTQFSHATAASSTGIAGTAVLAGGAALMATKFSKEGIEKGFSESITEAGKKAAAESATDAVKETAKKAGEEAAAKATKEAGGSITKEAAEKASKEASDKVLSDAASEASKKAAEDKAKQIAACASAVIMTATVAIKGAAWGIAADGEESACKSVEGLQSVNYNGVYVSATPQKGADTTGSLNAEIKANAGPKNKAATGADKPSLASDLGGTIAQATKAEANAGPNTPGGLLKKLDPHSLPDRMRALGLNPNKMAAELEAGKGVGDIMSGMSGMPAGLVAAIRDTENGARDGRFGWGGLAGSAYAGGRRGGSPAASAAKPASPFSFGAFGGASGPKAAELNFAAKKEKSVLTGDGDVFHEKFKGTIFEIISAKLDQNRTKVEQVDWQTPLNRAIIGLPPLARVPATASTTTTSTTSTPATSAPLKK